jgi:hexosaminidase
MEALRLADDLRSVIGRRLAVVPAPPRPGDIALRRTPGLRLGARAFMRREGYALGVGRVLTIQAGDPTGLFYGGRTILQLLRQHRWIHRGVARDWPRYRERGLMVDASRTIYTTGWMIREIKQLALLKLNLLHLHLTDDQRWGVVSRAYPGLASNGAFTYADVHRILRVAHRYHVMVVPEIEMPGHMAVFIAQHPSLELKPAAAVGGLPPTEYLTDKLDFTTRAGLHAARRLLDEYLRLFPGHYFDMGDDEVFPAAENAVFPQLLAYATTKYGVGATGDDALHGFINWVDRIVRSHHKTLRLWNDQLVTGGKVRVNTDVVVDWWTSSSPLGDLQTEPPAKLLQDGYRVLNAGWYPNYYTASIGPVAGKADMSGVYRTWHVRDFDGEELKNGQILSKQYVPANAPGVLGDAMSIWGPLNESTAATARGIARRLTVIAQKTWDSPRLTPSYVRFMTIASKAALPR